MRTILNESDVVPYDHNMPNRHIISIMGIIEGWDFSTPVYGDKSIQILDLGEATFIACELQKNSPFGGSPCGCVAMYNSKNDTITVLCYPTGKESVNALLKFEREMKEVCSLEDKVRELESKGIRLKAGGKVHHESSKH